MYGFKLLWLWISFYYSQQPNLMLTDTTSLGKDLALSHKVEDVYILQLSDLFSYIFALKNHILCTPEGMYKNVYNNNMVLRLNIGNNPKAHKQENR